MAVGYDAVRLIPVHFSNGWHFMAAQITYAAFITWLLAFKDAVPAVLEKLETAIGALMDAYELIKGTLPASQMSLTDEELSLEGDLAVAVAGTNAAWDGTRLRALFQFAKDSGLLPIIIQLLTK